MLVLWLGTIRQELLYGIPDHYARLLIIKVALLHLFSDLFHDLKHFRQLRNHIDLSSICTLVMNFIYFFFENIGQRHWT